MTLEEFLRAHRDSVVTISGYTCRRAGNDVQSDLRWVFPMGRSKLIKFYSDDRRMSVATERTDEPLLTDELGGTYIESWVPPEKTNVHGFPLYSLPLGTQALIIDTMIEKGMIP